MRQKQTKTNLRESLSLVGRDLRKRKTYMHFSETTYRSYSWNTLSVPKLRKTRICVISENLLLQGRLCLRIRRKHKIRKVQTLHQEILVAGTVVQASLYYQPKQGTIIGEIPQNYPTSALFDPPTIGNLMIRVVLLIGTSTTLTK